MIEFLLAFKTFKFLREATSFGIPVSLLFCKFSIVVRTSKGVGNSVSPYPEQSTTKLLESPSVWHTHGFGHVESPDCVAVPSALAVN